jgi:hypothetical protein
MISETWIDRDCFAALAMTAWKTFYESVNYDFMRMVQKIKAEPNASVFINSLDADLSSLTLFLGFFFFRRRECFTFCACG